MHRTMKKPSLALYSRRRVDKILNTREKGEREKRSDTLKMYGQVQSNYFMYDCLDQLFLCMYAYLIKSWGAL